MIPTLNLTRFIRQQERKHPHASGELTDLLNSIAFGVKIISQLVATAGFKGLQGYTGTTNVQGESVQILDQESDRTLIELLGSSGHFGMLVSEERDTVVTASEGRESGKYVVAFDPLDGSSNLGSNIPVGTIFAIWKKREQGRPASVEDFMQPGRALVAAGYAIYGAKTAFVYSVGAGVHGFTLDPSIGEFILTEEKIQSPARGRTYSINEGNAGQWSPPISEFVQAMKREDKDLQTPYSARYVGSLVADFDRNLKSGGIFLYPADKKNKSGKLRLLYEAIPLAFIAEQAGGAATDGIRDILDLIPEDIHQRSPLVIGTRHEVEWVRRLSKER
ncbi:MAG: class 1 fructose-bisphosphatase [Deltaproteobacteria bacterium]|nr:class 1 fructose-bisphosphatase [Deltaproteobacteria bacterium]